MRLVRALMGTSSSRRVERIAPTPPRRERAARTVSYLLIFAAGIWGLFGTLPQSLEVATHPWHLVVWFMFMSTSLVAAVSSLLGKYLGEFAVLPFLIGGAAMYSLAMLSVVITGENPGSGIGLFLVTALAAKLLGRFFSLSQLVRNPFVLLRVARHKRGGGGG